jgi:hypothetical protein
MTGQNIQTEFTYDLERMKKAVESKSVEVPLFETFEEFKRWLYDDLVETDYV